MNKTIQKLIDSGLNEKEATVYYAALVLGRRRSQQRSNRPRTAAMPLTLCRWFIV